MPNDLQSQYAMLVGFFLPPLIALILQHQWPTRLKTIVAFALVLLASIGTAYFENRLDLHQLLPTVFTVLTMTVTSFKALWQPTGAADHIERVTSL